MQFGLKTQKVGCDVSERNKKVDLLEVLACPYCKIQLNKETDILICPICSNQYLIKDNLYHLYHSGMEHWKRIMEIQEHLLKREPGYDVSGYDAGLWIGKLTEDNTLTLRANNAMFNVAIDFFGSDLYSDEYGLDFGCGQGWATTYLSQYRPMFALDASEYMSSAIPQETNKGICKVIADGHYMPFMDNSLGIVFSCSALHHIHDRAMGVREIHRILKPGGKYCGFGDMWTNEEGIQDYLSNSETREERWHPIIEGPPYSKEELYSWFDIGFSKVQIQPIVYKPHMHEFGYLNIASSEEERSNLIVMVTKIGSLSQ